MPPSTPAPALDLVSERCQVHYHENPDDGDAELCPGPPEVVCTCGCHERSWLWLLEAAGATHYMRREQVWSGHRVAWCDPYVRGRHLVSAARTVTCPRCDAKRYACEEVMG